VGKFTHFAFMHVKAIARHDIKIITAAAEEELLTSSRETFLFFLEEGKLSNIFDVRADYGSCTRAFLSILTQSCLVCFLHDGRDKVFHQLRFIIEISHLEFKHLEIENGLI
jgi:hypothetical protein